jgi:hypothetical protein
LGPSRQEAGSCCSAVRHTHPALPLPAGAGLHWSSAGGPSGPGCQQAHPDADVIGPGQHAAAPHDAVDAALALVDHGVVAAQPALRRGGQRASAGDARPRPALICPRLPGIRWHPPSTALPSTEARGGRCSGPAQQQQQAGLCAHLGAQREAALGVGRGEVVRLALGVARVQAHRLRGSGGVSPGRRAPVWAGCGPAVSGSPWQAA